MPTAPPTFHIQTLGCRVNQYDEEQLRRDFRLRGFDEVEFEAGADVYVINTCTVTHIADRKSRQLIRRALRQNPQARVIATGCAVGNKHALRQGIPARVIQVSNRDKERLLDVVREHLPPHHARAESTMVGQSRARALLKVQDGCNQFCTFCIVPFVRGRSRSKPPASVLEEARALVAAGYRELVVTGVHVGAYGRDVSDGRFQLGDLMRLLAEQSGASRIRLSSVEPADFPLSLLETMQRHGNICAHLHLALQHASDRVLERMRRGYTLAQYDHIVRQYFARFPEGALTADILVGFPGEDDADFEALYRYLERTPFAHLHVFPYSSRPGTAAARLPELEPAVLAARMDAILQLGRRAEQRFRERFLGVAQQVLIEEHHPDGICRGTTGNYLSLAFPGEQAEIGQLTWVVPTALSAQGLLGKRTSPPAREYCSDFPEAG